MTLLFKRLNNLPYRYTPLLLGALTSLTAGHPSKAQAISALTPLSSYRTVDTGTCINDPSKPSQVKIKRADGSGLCESIGVSKQSNTSLLACDPIINSKELFITDLSAVENASRTTPGGPWSFAGLIRKMKPDNITESQFVLDWLNTWNRDQTINRYLVTSRTAVQSRIIDPWLAASGGSSLDLNRAPLRLLSIVNRVDLRDTTNKLKAGEGRFVFEVLDSVSRVTSFTVIFEYALPILPATPTRGETNARWWAQQFHLLGQLPFSSETDQRFNIKLNELTEIFSSKQTPPGGNRAVSYLNQLRTNEIFIGSPWELREFKLSDPGLNEVVAAAGSAGTIVVGGALTGGSSLLKTQTTSSATDIKKMMKTEFLKQWDVQQYGDGGGGNTTAFANIPECRTKPIGTTIFLPSLRAGLIPVTVKQTPDKRFNFNTPEANRLAALSQWIVDNAPAINAGTVTPPNCTVAGSAREDFTWAVPRSGNPVDVQAANNFAVRTCNGCHTSETSTSFLHVGLRSVGQESPVSSFVRTDLTRRALDMQSLLCGSGLLPGMNGLPRNPRVH